MSQPRLPSALVNFRDPVTAVRAKAGLLFAGLGLTVVGATVGPGPCAVTGCEAQPLARSRPRTKQRRTPTT
jgi:hypothetical protein